MSFLAVTKATIRGILSRRRCDICIASTRVLSSSTSTPDNDTGPLYDVIISGGGMVGCAMACALGHESMFDGKKILLLEAAPDRGEFILPNNYANRTCAISPTSTALLDSFGAWEHIVSMRARPVKRMQVWESCSDSMITFDRDNMQGTLAHIVENDVTQAAITRQLQKVQDKVEIRYNTKVQKYTIPKPLVSMDSSSTSPWVKLKLDNGETLQTKLLIGADGFRSLVRESCNIHKLSWEYNQMAVVGTLQLTESDNNVAWQRFTPNGPIAILPLDDGHSSLVWTTTPGNAKTLLQMEEDNFVDALNTALWEEGQKDPLAVYAGQLMDQVINAYNPSGTSRAGRQLPPTITGVGLGSRASFPLGLSHSTYYVKSRVALIGDAAHRIHPLAGQGVNLGFGDVACLTNILTQAVRNGADLGSILHLSDYESERQRAILPVMATVDGLNRLYRTSLSPLVLLRTLGLQATNSISPLKDLIIAQAIG